MNTFRCRNIEEPAQSMFKIYGEHGPFCMLICNNGRHPSCLDDCNKCNVPMLHQMSCLEDEIVALRASMDGEPNE